MIKRRINIWNQVDKTVILLYLLLVIMGWFNIYAAVYSEENSGLFNFSQLYGKQFLWILSSIFLAIIVLSTDNRFYLFFSWAIYGLMLFLLLLVLIVGKEVNGAKSWFEVGGLRIQPSELAKFATALALAGFMHNKRLERNDFKVFVPATMIIMAPALLVMMQPDMGSTIVFFSLFLVLFREGLNPSVFVAGILMIVLFFLTLLVDSQYLYMGIILLSFLVFLFTLRKWKPYFTGLAIFLAILAIVYFIGVFILKSISIETAILISSLLFVVPLSWYVFQKKARELLVVYLFVIGSLIYVQCVDFGFNKVLKPHQQTRIELLLGLKSDPTGSGYSLNQSLISIGSGGLVGKGYLNGTQTKFRFVPAQSTDFIFCTVGEEWGFIGSALLIGLYLFLFVRLVLMAERQRSVFARVYGYGVVSILFAHFFINIGMTIGLVPVIGIPLPFFSYGGSSLWGFTILLFIFLRLDATRMEYLV